MPPPACLLPPWSHLTLESEGYRGYNILSSPSFHSVFYSYSILSLYSPDKQDFLNLFLPSSGSDYPTHTQALALYIIVFSRGSYWLALGPLPPGSATFLTGSLRILPRLRPGTRASLPKSLFSPLLSYNTFPDHAYSDPIPPSTPSQRRSLRCQSLCTRFRLVTPRPCPCRET